jgi:hypothetical protein
VAGAKAILAVACYFVVCVQPIADPRVRLDSFTAIIPPPGRCAAWPRNRGVTEKRDELAQLRAADPKLRSGNPAGQTDDFDRAESALRASLFGTANVSIGSISSIHDVRDRSGLPSITAMTHRAANGSEGPAADVSLSDRANVNRPPSQTALRCRARTGRIGEPRDFAYAP